MLSQLDGLAAKEGLLIIGTTNNPEVVDPALIHRPSRFDRVWLFNVPNQELRQEYLKRTLKQVDIGIIEEIARKTHGWSFAYLNELRISASIMAIQKKKTSPSDKDIWETFELLAAQFTSGQKMHRVSQVDDNVGFKVA